MVMFFPNLETRIVFAVEPREDWLLYINLKIRCLTHPLKKIDDPIWLANKSLKEKCGWFNHESKNIEAMRWILSLKKKLDLPAKNQGCQ